MIALRRTAIAAALLTLTGWSIGAASAQERQRNEPGQFDFYVLSLSWSPSYCDATTERGARPDTQQCGARPYSFVVHGLWPQYERGFPAFCQKPAPWVDRQVVSSMLDLMPSPRLVVHEWQRHGTCSGQTAQAYFKGVRQARDIVKIPAEYRDVETPLTVTPNAIEEAFVKANPGMSRGGIAVTCDSRRLSEVRICMSKDMHFRECPQVDKQSCRRDQVVMPPVRGAALSPR